MPIDLNNLPPYDQLPVKDGAPKRSAWGLFGDDDQLGTVNLLTPERIVEAARLIRKGAVFPMNLPIDVPGEPMFDRQPPEHYMVIRTPGIEWDDYLDSFYPQASSQWDSLRHIRHPRDGFYNGVKDEEINLEPGSKLGIENWARRGIVGRGVLLDVERHLRQQGTPLNQERITLIRRDVLQACALAQAVEIRPGDILLVRLGWLKWYLEEATPAAKKRLETGARQMGVEWPGLGPADEMAEYLWNLHIAAIAADNPAVDAWPLSQETGFLHFHLIPYFGMPVGEFWYLEELAADCAADGVYEFMLTSAPLNIPGGVGSPPNALAIK